jgi:hypothetical protein
MSISSTWTAWIGALRRQSASERPPRPAPPDAAHETGLDPLLCGCGWFDSSQDLRAGLAVIEHDGLEVTQSLRLWYARDAAAA